MRFVGVDGCKAGWLAIATDRASKWIVELYACMDDLWGDFGGAELILIDIPIGLPFRDSRTCDILARKLLGLLRFSVFPPP